MVDSRGRGDKVEHVGDVVGGPLNVPGDRTHLGLGLVGLEEGGEGVGGQVGDHRGATRQLDFERVGLEVLAFEGGAGYTHRHHEFSVRV